MKKTMIAAALLAAMSLGAQASDTLCPPSTDGFALMLEVSGSMMKPDTMKDADGEETSRIREAKLLASRLIAASRTDIASGLYTAAPFTVQLPLEKRTTEDYAKGLEKIPDDLETVGRMTWMGERGQKFMADAEHGSKTVVLITDGALTTWKADEKVDPKAVFEGFRVANPKNRLFVISVAENEEVKAKLDETTGVESVDLGALKEGTPEYEAFMDRVFDRTCEKPEPVEIVLKDMNFDFDRHNLNELALSELDKILPTVKELAKTSHIRIEGWTDCMGSDAYNAKLSQRRAESVMQYFVDHGIPTERMETAGHGKSFKFDNATKQGRWENRHVHLVFTQDGVTEEK